MEGESRVCLLTFPKRKRERDRKKERKGKEREKERERGTYITRHLPKYDSFWEGKMGGEKGG